MDATCRVLPPGITQLRVEGLSTGIFLDHVHQTAQFEEIPNGFAQVASSKVGTTGNPQTVPYRPTVLTERVGCTSWYRQAVDIVCAAAGNGYALCSESSHFLQKLSRRTLNSTTSTSTARSGGASTDDDLLSEESFSLYGVRRQP